MFVKTTNLFENSLVFSKSKISFINALLGERENLTNYHCRTINLYPNLVEASTQRMSPNAL
jgi:hypothetical protein